MAKGMKPPSRREDKATCSQCGKHRAAECMTYNRWRRLVCKACAAACEE